MKNLNTTAILLLCVLFVNSLSANIINIFNFCVFILFYNNLLKTKILVLIVIFNLIVYLTTYFLIKKKLNHLK